jgi:hypothetical protein
VVLRNATNGMMSDPKSEVVENMVRQDDVLSSRCLDPVMVVVAISICVLIATCGCSMVGDAQVVNDPT